MRKKMRGLLSLGIAAIVLASCSTSNEVVSSGIFQKRKHTGGIFIKPRGAEKTDEQVAVVEKKKPVSKEVVAETKAVAQVEETQVAAVAQQEEAAVASTQGVDRAEVAETREDAPKAEKRETTSEKAVTSAEKREVRKALKKEVKHQKNKKTSGASDDGAMFILAIIFAILIPPLGVLIYTAPDIDWLKVLICLLLTFLFFLPGMIYALLVVFGVI